MRGYSARTGASGSLILGRSSGALRGRRPFCRAFRNGKYHFFLLSARTKPKRPPNPLAEHSRAAPLEFFPLLIKSKKIPLLAKPRTGEAQRKEKGAGFLQRLCVYLATTLSPQPLWSRSRCGEDGDSVHPTSCRPMPSGS